MATVVVVGAAVVVAGAAVVAVACRMARISWRRVWVLIAVVVLVVFKKKGKRSKTKILQQVIFVCFELEEMK